MRSTIPTSYGFTPIPRPGVPPVMSPLPASTKSAFVNNFEFVGTIDNAPYLCLPAAVKYRQDTFGGEDAIAAYLVKLAHRAGEIVSGMLGTDVLENEEGTLQNCAFSNVRLPLELNALHDIAQARGSISADALVGPVRDWMSLLVIREYGSFIALMWYAGSFWVRLSAQVYLDEEAFKRAGEILTDVCKRVKKGEFIEALPRESKL
jgi:selenocysteine lyase/cysteine desulfurase